MTTERARAILKIHPEFQDLSDADQVTEVLKCFGQLAMDLGQILIKPCSSPVGVKKG